MVVLTVSSMGVWVRGVGGGGVGGRRTADNMGISTDVVTKCKNHLNEVLLLRNHNN